ncbi:hypothetical protein IPM62_00475 [Candidatus Woesebacteria bacterium]|nr:MAG: hypothetical protein IPM62_00475 [Candidatus Woesebacteria bacterium]
MQKLAVDIGAEYHAPIVSGETGPIIANLIIVVYTIAGVIILFAIVSAGFNMVKGAGNNSPDDMAKSKKTITFALIGFFVMFMSYWIIQYIEFISGSEFITNSVI